MQRRGVWIFVLVLFLVLTGLSLWFDCKLEQVRKERRELETILDRLPGARSQ